MSLEDQLYKYLSFYKKLPDWSKKILATPFKILPREKYIGKLYYSFYQEALMFEFASAERIHEYQFIKLKNILKHAYNSVPYYRNLWNKYKINLNTIKDYNDFYKSIPLLNKKDIQKNISLFISDKYPLKYHLKYTSGGSTGVPLTLYQLKGFSRAAEWAHMHLLWERAGYTRGKRIARLRGDFIGKNKIYSFDPWRNYLILSSFKLNKNNINYYIYLLNKYNIEYINAYPSSLYNLVQLSNKQKVRIPSLKGILLGSENIFKWQLNKFKEFFQIDNIFYWYGHGELCALAGICNISNYYHFMPTYSYVEFSNKTSLNNNSVEIIGTSFINPLMPLIRYKTQDIGIITEDNCKCGRHHSLLKEIIGREQEIAIGKNGENISVTALIFGRHSNYFNKISRIQLINTAPGKLVVKIIPLQSFTKEDEKEIISNLSEKEGMPFDTKVEIVNTIAKTNRGKHRFLIRTFKL